MAGRGSPPKDADSRINRAEPERGEITPAAGVGWQHGAAPKAPTGLMPASREAWKVWMGAWFASFWSPDDLPGLRQVVRLYDQVERGEFQRAAELRLQMDTYGITPKGQQDRRWKAPQKDAPTQVATPSGGGRYSRLRAVPDALETGT